MDFLDNIFKLDPIYFKFVRDVRKYGGEVYVVGGAVRDWVTGQEPHDIDLEVHGLTEQDLTDIPLWDVRPAGDRFGIFLVRYLWDNSNLTFEVGLPQRRVRTGRGHGAEVAVIDPHMGIVQACARRDYTVNSMAVCFWTGELVDPFAGMDDLRNGVLRATRPENYADDPLRVLRGIQLCSRYNLIADPATAQAARDNAAGFNDLSLDRVREEWRKFATGNFPAAGIWFLWASGWLAHFPTLHNVWDVAQDPEWHPEGNVGAHTLLVLNAIANTTSNPIDPVVVFACLLHDIGKVNTTEVLPDGRIVSPGHADASADLVPDFFRSIGWQWKGDAPEFVQQVQAIIREHMWIASFKHQTPGRNAVRRLVNRLAPATLEQWEVLVWADAFGRAGSGSEWRSDMLQQVMAIGSEIAAPDQPGIQPLVMGRDLIAAGVMSPCKAMGDVLRATFDAQLDGMFDTTEDGVAFARQVWALMWLVGQDW